MNIGDRIKERRLLLGLTADDLGKKLGKSRATIYRYENGDIENLPLDILEPIAKALGTAPQYLMGWEDVKKNNDILSDIIIRAQKNDKFLDVMKSLFYIPDDRLDMAKAVIDALNQ